MKDQILKIAKVKSEKEFYKKYPTEEAFMAKHGKALKKAAMGSKMVQTQLKQLTDFGNPPVAQDGGIFNIAKSIGSAFTTPGKAATATSAATPASGGLGDTLQSMFGGDPSAFGNANPKGALGAGGQGLGAGAKAAGIGVLNAAPQILEGIGAIKEQKKAIKKADQASQISGVVAQASESRDISKPKNQYVRPEDQPAMGAMNPQGTGTNFLAQYGAQIGGNPTEIQNTYNPGDLYSDLGYEPLNDSNVKQFAYGGNLPTAEFGDYFQDSGQAQIGGAAGEAIGSAFFGPLGGKAGKFLGKVAGNLLGGAKDANQLANFQDTTRINTERAAMQQGAQAIQGANSAFMEDGGWMNPEYNPQMIAKFGDYSMKQLLQPPHDADMLRAGGHLKEYTPPSERAMQTYEDGGYMAMGGDLQVYRGKAEPISYNPFLPDNGETVMFKGPSHDDGGMPISYGQNGVEVEGGEPAVKLADGGSPDGSLVVFGNMKIDDMAANHIGVEAAKGKKYKRFIDDLSKFESKQNKVAEKGTELVNSANTNDPFEQLSMNAGRAMMMGSNAKLLNAAIIKQRAAGVQNAILDTAKEYGVKSDELSKGKFVKDKNSDMAKFGAKMETAQDGSNLKAFLKTPYAERKKLAKELGYADYAGKDVSQQEKLYDLFKSKSKPLAPGDGVRQLKPFSVDDIVPQFGPKQSPVTIPYAQNYLPEVVVKSSEPEFHPPSIEDMPGFPTSTKKENKFDWKGLGESALSNVMPLFRPTDQEALDPNQLYPEMFALASNQLEPVRAQQFQPMLKESYNVSLQDQLNEVDAQARAASRQIGSNPSAAAQLFAAATDAKNKIRGEQMRINQAQQTGIRNENIAALNQAQEKNLQILDKQYERQDIAKSKTRQQTLEALKSIAAKTAQNKLENRQLGVMENMYNFRFGPRGQAINFNDPQQFNIPEGIGLDNISEINKAKIKDYYEKIINKDNLGNVTGSKEKSSTSKTSRNGSIVKALKTL